jgi:hypothetical protein
VISGKNRWRNRAVFAVLVVLLLAGFARFEKTTPLFLPMTMLVFAVVAIVGLILDSAEFAAPDWSVAPDHDTFAQGQDTGLGGNVRLIENHLSTRTEDTLLPGRLARMADDRLRRLGLGREDPAVRERLGPTLCGVLDGRVRALRVSDIEECVRRIEELS